MKLAVRIRLTPDAEPAASLKAMVERFNAAADWIAGELFARELSNKIEAQRLLYREVRERFGLSAQTAILCIHRACEAYKRDSSVRPRFRRDAGMTYDVRTMSFKGIDRVSLLTLSGRIVVPMIVTGYQAERIGYPKGQCDLVRRGDGRWYLFVTVDVPDGSPIEPDDFIGVDLRGTKHASRRGQFPPGGRARPVHQEYDQHRSLAGDGDRRRRRDRQQRRLLMEAGRRRRAERPVVAARRSAPARGRRRSGRGIGRACGQLRRDLEVPTGDATPPYGRFIVAMCEQAPDSPQEPERSGCRLRCQLPCTTATVTTSSFMFLK
jgi:putative transposase